MQSDRDRDDHQQVATQREVAGVQHHVETATGKLRGMPAVACTITSSISSSMPIVAHQRRERVRAWNEVKTQQVDEVAERAAGQQPPARTRSPHRQTLAEQSTSSPRYAAPTEAAAYDMLILCITPKTSVKPIPISRYVAPNRMPSAAD